ARRMAAHRLGARAVASRVGAAGALSMERAALLHRAPAAASAMALSPRARVASPLGRHDAVLGVQLPPGRVVPARQRDAARARVSRFQPMGAAGSYDHESAAQRRRPSAGRASARAILVRGPPQPLPQYASSRVSRPLRLLVP